MRRILFILLIPLHYILGIPWLLLTFLVGVFNRKLRRRMAYRFNRITSWLIMTIAGATFIVDGKDNLPKDTTVLYVSNHRSMLDIPTLVLQSKQPINFIGKKSLLKWPFVGWWMYAMDGLFLDRSNPREGLKTILEGIERLKSGDSFVVFPEGTRSREEGLLPFKQGSLKLASKSGVLIIPVAIHGTEKIFENNGANLKPGIVFVSFGEPIDLSVLSKEDQLHSAAYVQNIITQLYNEHLEKETLSRMIQNDNRK
ncbi:MAG: 1-acyl-sn-glycerol-3-phosphate acyltransferase [Vallitaleaceae bacterium]|nr:1-acyl-sn-glycerol-3-phosphate acyltransferase [Vallitaleaceae bacterium]